MVNSMQLLNLIVTIPDSPLQLITFPRIEFGLDFKDTLRIKTSAACILNFSLVRIVYHHVFLNCEKTLHNAVVSMEMINRPSAEWLCMMR